MSDEVESPAAQASGPGHRRSLVGWLLLAVLAAYAVYLHHGIGPPRHELAPPWYDPRGFLWASEFFGPLFEPEGPLLAMGGFGLPAFLLAIGVFLTTRSAIARTLAVGCAIAGVFYVFYGLAVPGVWQLFHWRASAVFTIMAFALALALMAPLLAGSWLRLSWPLRALVYLPFLFVVLAFVRNATGTDPNLMLALSPWPAVSVFGIEVGGMIVGAWLAGLATGLVLISKGLLRESGSAMWMLAGGVLAIVTPAVLLYIGDAASVFPFKVKPGLVFTVGFLAAIGCAIGATLGLGRSEGGLPGRARRVAVGAVLLGVPLLGGQALARYDYYVTREVRAQSIIDALASYFEREDGYPDELEALVEAGDLEAIPAPDIGFGFLYDSPFRYQSFGTSFVLEFPAPRWVECAYTPPYDDDDEAYEEDDEDLEPWERGYADVAAGPEDLEDLEPWEIAELEAQRAAAAEEAARDEPVPEEELGGGAWSCPSKPPELW